MDRRRFLATAAVLTAAGCARPAPPLPPGALLGTAHAAGHLLRDGGVPRGGAIERRRREVVIVGAGIGGLSAAWRLRRAGFGDFELLELESAPGGNARWGENAVSAYPWGAHYLPLPTREARATRLLLAELGVLRGDPQAAAPEYDERALCAVPQERHYRNGTWFEGLGPLEWADAAERAEWIRFGEEMEGFRVMRGADGRRAFALPLAHSSSDPALRALDGMTMLAWLKMRGYVSAPVHWMVRYACRDDYGCEPRDVSAWAGIHYFASRDGRAANAERETVLTWPEGTGWIVRRLGERLAPPITARALVHRVEPQARGLRLSIWLAAERRALEIDAAQVIWAAPLQFAARALSGIAPALRTALSGFEQAPWLTANLTLEAAPLDAHGATLAWDNVPWDGPSLGYIVATHQHAAATRGATVLTWYLPLSGGTPAEGRRRLLETPRERWAAQALDELAGPHPEVRETVRRLDVYANGHAMVRPRPGLIWGEARRRVLDWDARVHFAHADASGISIFEEAQYRGVAAAERVLARMGDHSASIL